MEDKEEFFTVVVSGQIESAEFPGASSLCCVYSFEYGHDWEITKPTGVDQVTIENGITQVSLRKSGNQPLYVWNFPIEIAFRSTNISGWPKLILTIAESNGKSKYKPIGYGWIHIPLSPGQFVNTVKLFSPQNSSLFQSILSTILQKPPQFINPSFVAQNNGREVVRVSSKGSVRIRWNVMIKNMIKFGLEPHKSIESRGLTPLTEEEEAMLEQTLTEQKQILQQRIE